MKSFAERSPLIIGAVGVTLIIGVVAVALQYDKLPLPSRGTEYSAYFAEAGGLTDGAAVQVAGFGVGKVSNIELDGPRVLVTFKVDNSIQLRDRTEAAIKTKSLLGAKVLEVTPLGEHRLTETIPTERTISPYQLPDALGDLATTVGDLDTERLSDSLDTLSQTFRDTPTPLRDAVAGVTRLSRTLNTRDDHLRDLLANANKASVVLAERANQIVTLITHVNSLLAELQTHGAALDEISNNVSYLAGQLSGFITENRQQMKPALDKLNGVLTTVDNRRERIQKSIKLLNAYTMSLGEAVSSGPFFNAYVANLLPGQFVQPFVDAAFSDLGLDPHTLLPSQRTDPQVGQPGTPALPVPMPRTGQAGPPNMTLPDAITGDPNDPRYPYREPLPAPMPGGPPPGPPALPPPPLPNTAEPHPRRATRRLPRVHVTAHPRQRRLTASRRARNGLAAALIAVLAAGVVVTMRSASEHHHTHVVAYFANSNGVFVGDEVHILGVPVGKIDRIEPQPGRAKISFWFDDKYQVPANAAAVILSPSLVTARAIQLTPAYSGGPVMRTTAVIPQERTAVPVEWDDFRTQLEKLTQMLQPVQPGDVSTLGAFVNTTADNLRGQGTAIRKSIIELSQALSVFRDHSDDIFGTVRNLSIFVSALRDSATLLKQLNRSLASVTAMLANDPDEIASAVADLSTATADVQTFVAENRDSLGVTTDKLASVSQALVNSLDDIKQTLHIAPTGIANFINVYQPAQGALSGALVVNNFADPITFLCGAIQAASRLGAEQSAKLCAQYLAPIVKNRQYNFPPIGLNPFVGAAARPNEVTFSEDSMRPDYRPSARPQPAVAPLPAEMAPAIPTDPATGLPGMMLPPGGGS